MRKRDREYLHVRKRNRESTCEKKRVHVRKRDREYLHVRKRDRVPTCEKKR